MDNAEDDSDEDKSKPASKEFLCEPVQNQAKSQHLNECSHSKKDKRIDQDFRGIDPVDPIIAEQYHKKDHKSD